MYGWWQSGFTVRFTRLLEKSHHKTIPKTAQPCGGNFSGRTNLVFDAGSQMEGGRHTDFAVQFTRLFERPHHETIPKTARRLDSDVAGRTDLVFDTHAPD